MQTPRTLRKRASLSLVSGQTAATTTNQKASKPRNDLPSSAKTTTEWKYCVFSAQFCPQLSLPSLSLSSSHSARSFAAGVLHAHRLPTHQILSLCMKAPSGTTAAALSDTLSSTPCGTRSSTSTMRLWRRPTISPLAKLAESPRRMDQCTFKIYLIHGSAISIIHKCVHLIKR